MNKNKLIKLMLHHNYLQIDDGKNEKIQLPIRCAKLIHDMYEIRQADNEEKDIEHYTDEYNNHAYDVSVFLMNIKYNNYLSWFTKYIKPLKLKRIEK